MKTRGNHITSTILPEPIRLNLHKLVCVDEAMSCRPSIRNTFPSHIPSVSETRWNLQLSIQGSVIRCDVHNNRCAQNKHLNYHSVVAWYADHRRRRHWRSSSSSPLYSTNQTKKKKRWGESTDAGFGFAILKTYYFCLKPPLSTQQK